MGRTISKYRDDEDDYGRKKSSKNAKHSRNIPGEGMRVINKWSEDDIDEEDEWSDFDIELDDEYNAYISQTQRK